MHKRELDNLKRKSAEWCYILSSLSITFNISLSLSEMREPSSMIMSL